MTRLLRYAALALSCACNFSPVTGEPPATGLDGACTPACGAGETCSFGKCICDPATCAGCCAAEKCLVGTEVEACGSGGGACQSCDAQTEGPFCTNKRCGCMGDLQCASSLNGPVCLAGRCGCATSASCADGQTCTADLKCRSTGCDAAHPCKNGCCDASGACVARDQCAGNLACGTDGLCPAACDADHPCNGGCCVDGACVAGDTTELCGGNGKACAACMDGSLCTDHACTCSDESQCPAAFACNNGSCTESCDVGHACNLGCCDGGTCVLAHGDESAALQCLNVPSRPFCLASGTCGCRSSSDCGGTSVCLPGKSCGSCGSGECVNAGACTTDGASAGPNKICGSNAGACSTCGGGSPYCNGVACRACANSATECGVGQKCLAETAGADPAGACVTRADLCHGRGTQTDVWFPGINVQNCRASISTTCQLCTGTLPVCDPPSIGCRACAVDSDCQGGSICFSDGHCGAGPCTGCRENGKCYPGNQDPHCGGGYGAPEVACASCSGGQCGRDVSSQVYRCETCFTSDHCPNACCGVGQCDTGNHTCTLAPTVCAGQTQCCAEVPIGPNSCYCRDWGGASCPQ